jgi:hypothetical protein
VQLNHSEKFRKLKYRRLVPGVCQSCGGQFFYRRTGRPKIFCNQRCRQTVRQDGQADFRRFGHHPGRIDESVPKSKVISKAFRHDFADRSPAFEVLGNGYRWPGHSAVDREILREILTTEIPERRNPTTIKIPDDDYWRIPEDLPIPKFLRRVQS